MIALPVISILVSLGAFTFSLYAWRERIRQDQRDLFLNIHERLVGIENQRGRRILFHRVNSVEDARSLFNQNPEEYDLANMALAMLHTAALYVERGYIDERIFMEEWGVTYKDIYEHAQFFMTERAERNAARPIGHFYSFSSKASKHQWPEIGTRITASEGEGLP